MCHVQQYKVVLLQHKHNIQHPSHPPIHRTTHRVPAAQQYESTLMQVSLMHRSFLQPPVGTGLSTLPACRRVRRQEARHFCSNSITAEAARTACDPPAHLPNDPQITTAQQDVRRQYLNFFMQTGVGLLHRIGGQPVVTTPSHIGDPIRLLPTLPDGRG